MSDSIDIAATARDINETVNNLAARGVPPEEKKAHASYQKIVREVILQYVFNVVDDAGGIVPIGTDAQGQNLLDCTMTSRLTRPTEHEVETAYRSLKAAADETYQKIIQALETQQQAQSNGSSKS